jgi:hypothetical protein
MRLNFRLFSEPGERLTRSLSAWAGDKLAAGFTIPGRGADPTGCQLRRFNA